MVATTSTRPAKLIAYHGDPKIKTAILKQLAKHRKADQLVQGYGYWDDGRGCAVGCTLHSDNHSEYETRFGIPVVLPRLKDRIFDGLPVKLARRWPERFMSAIQPGADLSGVWPKFALWLLMDQKAGTIRVAKTAKEKRVIAAVGELYASVVRGESVPASAWVEARSVAAYVARAAAYVAAYAAYVAAYAAADAYAATAATVAATVAATAATTATAKNARECHMVVMADKLIELIEACSPKGGL